MLSSVIAHALRCPPLNDVLKLPAWFVGKYWTDSILVTHLDERTANTMTDPSKAHRNAKNLRKKYIGAYEPEEHRSRIPSPEKGRERARHERRGTWIYTPGRRRYVFHVCRQAMNLDMLWSLLRVLSRMNPPSWRTQSSVSSDCVLAGETDYKDRA